MRWTLLTLLLALTAVSLSNAADPVDVDEDEELDEDIKAVNEDFDGDEEGDGVQLGGPTNLRPDIRPPDDPIPEAAPEVRYAVKIKSQKTRGCIGNSNNDHWIDVKTRCSTWRIPQFEYTRDNQLRDIHTGMCLDTRNHIYRSNGKAYPIMDRCDRRRVPQKFFFIRMRGRDNYRIMTLINDRWMFGGSDQDRDLVFENFIDCTDCQTFSGWDKTMDALF